jgi:subtilisin family serine protease
MRHVRRRRLLLALAALSALVLVACTPKVTPAPPAPSPTTTTTTLGPRVHCTSAQATASSTTTRALTTSEAKSRAVTEFDTAGHKQANGAVPLVTVERSGRHLKFTTTDVASADQAAAVAASASQGSDLLSVAAAEPVQALEATTSTATTVSTDPMRVQQWALDKANFESVWPTTNGAGITVAVVDTGVQADHPDLEGQVLPGYQKWTDGTGTSFDGPMDPSFDNNGHGTHVAGIIAALADNSVGVAGAAPGVKILPVKVLNASGSGWDADVAAGIDWAVSNGANVINLSLGGGQSPTIGAAIDNAVANNVMVFAAGGNGGVGASPSYPGAEPNAIGVASVDQSLARSSYSTTGSYIDVAAPGRAVLSTYLSSGYTTLSGTSMATPYAAAAGALLRAEHPTWNVAQVRDRLLTTADDLGVSGRDSEYGCGFIDPPAAA